MCLPLSAMLTMADMLSVRTSLVTPPTFLKKCTRHLLKSASPLNSLYSNEWSLECPRVALNRLNVIASPSAVVSFIPQPSLPAAALPDRFRKAGAAFRAWLSRIACFPDEMLEVVV